MPSLRGRPDDLGVIAIGEHGSSTAIGLVAADGGVEVLGSRDLEALHARRQGGLVVGLDDEVEMRALDAEVDDPEVLAARRGERRLADRLVGEPSPQVADVSDDAQHDVDRMSRG